MENLFLILSHRDAVMT